MKKLLYFTLIVLYSSLYACGGHSHEHGENGHTHSNESAQPQEAGEQKKGKEYTSAYVCPMHCEGSGSDEPGKCPACGMDYVALSEHSHEDHSGQNHTHEHTH